VIVDRETKLLVSTAIALANELANDGPVQATYEMRIVKERYAPLA